MKKYITVLGLAMLLSVKGNCQLDKGNWLVGGNARYSTNKIEVPELTYSQKTVRWEIRPIIGYFITNKFVGGLSLGYLFEKSRDTYFSHTNGRSFSLGPFVKYYFLPKEQLINVFTQASYYYGNLKTTNLQANGNPSSYSSTYGYSFLAGPVIYFNSSVGLELNIGYYHQNNAGTLHNSIEAGIGLQIHLKKK